VEEIFMRSPPARVKPERNEAEEFCSTIRFVVWAGAERTARLGPTTFEVGDDCWTRRDGAVEEEEIRVVVATTAPVASKGVVVPTWK